MRRRSKSEDSSLRRVHPSIISSTISANTTELDRVATPRQSRCSGMVGRACFYTLKMGSFRLRIATSDDVDGIRELIEASVRGLQTPDYSVSQREGALATVFTVDSQLIADGTYFLVAAEDGRLAGCGGWSYRKTLYGGDHQVEKIVPARLNPSVDAAKIRAIFVHPDFARMGLGSLILETAENAAVAAGFRRFEMGSTLTGVALYTLKGYREKARIKVPIANGQTIDVVRMVKEL
jgi:GNAT superfamily N-acetyltransferase